MTTSYAIEQYYNSSIKFTITNVNGLKSSQIIYFKATETWLLYNVFKFNEWQKFLIGCMRGLIFCIIAAILYKYVIVKLY